MKNCLGCHPPIHRPNPAHPTGRQDKDIRWNTFLLIRPLINVNFRLTDKKAFFIINQLHRARAGGGAGGLCRASLLFEKQINKL